MVKFPSLYTNRYVAFVDILGFSELVRTSPKSPVQVYDMVSVLESIRDRFDPVDETKRINLAIRAQSFSDCTVLSAEGNPDGLFDLLLAVDQLILELLSKGILVRGGIAKGELHHSDRVVVGPAMLSAYALERDVAKVPRVVLDRSTHQDYLACQGTGKFQSWDSWTKPSVICDTDGPPFVHYLGRYGNLTGAPSRSPVIGKACRKVIDAKLRESIYNPRHYEKLLWLAQYWNGCRSHGTLGIAGMELIDLPSSGRPQHIDLGQITIVG